MISGLTLKRFRLALLLPLLLVCSCPGALMAGEILRYAGATTLQRDFMPEAASLFAAASGIRFSISGGNTDPGIKALQAGHIDLAGAGRALRAEERKAGLREVQIGWDPLAVVVHRSNPISDLTPAQLKGIFAGKTRNWKELGGRDEQIVLVSGPEGSGMHAAVQELILGTQGASPYAVISPVVSDEDQMVARMTGGICAISKSMVDQAEVKLLDIGGTKIGETGYPLQKPLYLVTRGNPSPAVKRFVDFALSPAGQKVMAKKFLPVIRP